jgi:hypothetical protein
MSATTLDQSQLGASRLFECCFLNFESQEDWEYTRVMEEHLSVWQNFEQCDDSGHSLGDGLARGKCIAVISPANLQDCRPSSYAINL